MNTPAAHSFLKMAGAANISYDIFVYHTSSLLSCGANHRPVLLTHDEYVLSIYSYRAEQLPDDWWRAMTTAVRNVMEQCKREGKHVEVRGLCVDTTACSVVALDQNMKPLRPCLLWMDGRAADQCDYILEKAKGDPALEVNCGGQGPLSAEWMIPKALWIKQKEPKVWDQASYICEKQDYINYLLTGKLFMSGCNAAIRWHVDTRKACELQHEDKHAGRLELYP